MPKSGRGTRTDLANALFAAAETPCIDIVCVALAGDHGEPRLRKAVKAVTDKGIALYCGAGNDPAIIGYPAAYNGATSVGAYDKRGLAASFSPSGVDCVMPGANIPVCWKGGGYRTASGTSLAAPAAAAVMALELALSMATNGGTKQV